MIYLIDFFSNIASSTIATILGTLIVGAVAGGYIIFNNNKCKNNINQKGNNNTAFMNTTININSDKGESNDR
jgi:hypothetical protein